MRLITKKRKIELLEKIAECQKLINNFNEMDIKDYDKITENLCEISIIVGGIDGAYEVMKKVF